MVAKSLRHQFFCTIPDDGDATLVRPSNWNDDHDFWMGHRVVTGATDTLNHADWFSLIRYNRDAGVAVTLTVPSAGNFPLGWKARLRNEGSGTVSLRGASVMINGAASISVEQGETLDLHGTGTANYVGVRVPRLEPPLLGAVLWQDPTAPAGTIQFQPWRGRFMRHNGELRVARIPGYIYANNTIVNGASNQSLAPWMTYLVFATDIGGTLQAAFFEQGAFYRHGPSSTPGNEGTEILWFGAVPPGTPNDNYSFIGLVALRDGLAFIDTFQYRLVRSWFNDVVGPMFASRSGAEFTTNTTAWLGLGAQLSIEWVNFAGEILNLSFICPIYNELLVPGSAQTRIIMDPTWPGEAAIEGSVSWRDLYADWNAWDLISRGVIMPSEGYHWALPQGRASGTTATWWTNSGVGVGAHVVPTMQGIIIKPTGHRTQQ